MSSTVRLNLGPKSLPSRSDRADYALSGGALNCAALMMRRPRDYQGHCLTLLRLCGGRLQSWKESFRFSVQRRVDALQHIRVEFYVGVQGNKCTSTRRSIRVRLSSFQRTFLCAFWQLWRFGVLLLRCAFDGTWLYFNSRVNLCQTKL